MAAPALQRSSLLSLSRHAIATPVHPNFTRHYADVPPPPVTNAAFTPKKPGEFSALSDILSESSGRSSSTLDSSNLMGEITMDYLLSPTVQKTEEHHFHIYSTKHNTHITFTKPDKSPIISLSAGNIGFRKSHRGSYDAAYQLSATVFKKIEQMRIRPRGVEVVLRGFGQGREAVIKAFLGQEGRVLREVVRRVTDSTRLKFGGTRSKKPRRLG